MTDDTIDHQRGIIEGAVAKAFRSLIESDFAQVDVEYDMLNQKFVILAHVHFAITDSLRIPLDADALPQLCENMARQAKKTMRRLANK